MVQTKEKILQHVSQEEATFFQMQTVQHIEETKIQEFYWKFEVDYQLTAFVGTEGDKVKPLPPLLSVHEMGIPKLTCDR